MSISVTLPEQGVAGLSWTDACNNSYWFNSTLVVRIDLGLPVKQLEEFGSSHLGLADIWSNGIDASQLHATRTDGDEYPAVVRMDS